MGFDHMRNNIKLFSSVKKSSDLHKRIVGCFHNHTTIAKTAKPQ